MSLFLRASADGQSASEKAAVTFTLGIFFDGTTNNALNIRRRLEASALDDLRLEDSDALEAWTEAASADLGLGGRAITSHIGYYTNIHWLNMLYATDLTEGQIQQNLYIEGIGTAEGEADTALSMAFGTGERGIVAKTDKAVAAIVEVLRGFVIRQPNLIINELQFDIFGFSRGAAAARHFANRVFYRDDEIIAAIKRGLEGVEYRGTAAGKTRFLGLFDTVAAVATLENGMDPNSADNGDVMLELRPGVAEKVFHLTAQHECRFNFALNSVQPAWPEVALPGVHSDIGGGYHAVEEEVCFLTRPRFETVPLTTADDATRVYRAASEELKALRRYPTIAPYLESGEVEICTWSDDCIAADRYGMLQKRSGAAVVLRRKAHNDWAKIALRVMIDAATAAGVAFNAIDDAGEALALPSQLQHLCDKAIALSHAVRHGRETVGFTEAEINRLAADYLHCSANWNTVTTDADGKVTGAVKAVELASFVNRPDAQWRRTVYNLNGEKMS
ncbi:phospholipase effector Tle1 domain-containing protein [Erwinia phyllosphaerae]|uniref:phospholipase effector Tle1 domain-containing protein n=1 Tax=Erwinia phyllosphaerae TaxID=2853256 RepID=UPI001FEF685E|nr:DUF2235 domain-containing protein [Erwinia phyllosphaerae]MBV4367460.1 DUF2235 domain-containing protein [Erwinia phyllosphaerae]